MITISIDPVIFSIGHLVIRWYSLIVMLAVGVGVWITSREARRKAIGDQDFGTAVSWVIVAGLVGARLFHVIDHWPHEYAADPARALYVWKGGLAIWGGVIGGFLALACFAWRRHFPVRLLADIAAPGLALGQALGRVACIITGDAMGKPTNGPLGFAYTNPGAMVPQLGVFYTPTPVFEIVMTLGIFALLWRLRRRDLPQGALFLIYLVLYASGRFIITFWSSYQIVAWGLNQAQMISLGALLVGLPSLLIVLSGPKRVRPIRSR
jgi:phosphatidylglycerol---prolipoprotein diacylglyceryl transferase